MRRELELHCFGILLLLSNYLTHTAENSAYTNLESISQDILQPNHARLREICGECTNISNHSGLSVSKLRQLPASMMLKSDRNFLSVWDRSSSM